VNGSRPGAGDLPLSATGADLGLDALLGLPPKWGSALSAAKEKT